MIAPTMPRVCCVCGTVYGQTPCEPSLAGKAAHGYCAEHAAAARAEIAAAGAALPAAPLPAAPLAGYMPLEEIALICGLGVDNIARRVPLPGWSEGNHWARDSRGVVIRDVSVADFVGELSTTHEGAAALRLMLWISRANEASYPAQPSGPRHVRVPWYRQEAFA